MKRRLNTNSNHRSSRLDITHNREEFTVSTDQTSTSCNKKVSGLPAKTSTEIRAHNVFVAGLTGGVGDEHDLDNKYLQHSYQGLRMCQSYQLDTLNKGGSLQDLCAVWCCMCFIFVLEQHQCEAIAEQKPPSRHGLFFSYFQDDTDIIFIDDVHPIKWNNYSKSPSSQTTSLAMLTVDECMMITCVVLHVYFL